MNAGSLVLQFSTMKYPRDVAVTFCFFLSGASALALEICWIRKASFVFGSTTLALSTVLAVFFGGLAAGSFVLGRASTKISRPLLLYGILELGVGVSALLTLTGFNVVDAVFDGLYPQVSGKPIPLATIRIALICCVIWPPTVLMGASLPLLCRHYVQSNQRIAFTVGALYGLNTLGAAAGAACCGFVLIPTLGVSTTIIATGILSILIGLVACRIGRSASLPSCDQDELSEQSMRVDEVCSNVAAPKSSAFVTVHVLFLLTGFVAVANEVIWTRFLSLLIHNTVHTYTITLVLVLVGISLGSVSTGWLFDRTPRRAFIFGIVQVLNGTSVLFVLMLPASWWADTFGRSTGESQIFLFMLVMFWPALLSGISFPLAVRMVLSSPRLAGMSVGGMSAVNLVGGIMGSLLVGFILLPVLGLQASLRVTTGISLLIGFAAWFLLDNGRRTLVRPALAILFGAVWAMIPRLTGTQIPHDMLAHGGELVTVREGRASHLAIVRKDGRLRLEMDKLWQGDDHKNHQIMAAHIPMLLHPNPRSVLAVGMGAGQTLSRFLLYDIDRLDCVEIEPALPDLVRDYYDHDWMDDSRVQILIGDGRNFVHHTDGLYDVISIAVGQTFRSGVASFYTVEFYRAAADRLTATGVICQFMPLSYFTQEEFRGVVGTFVDTFPSSVLWYNTSELLLIGGKGSAPRMSRERLALANSDSRLRDDMEFAYWGGPAHWLHHPQAILAGFLVGAEGLTEIGGQAPIATEDLPRLEYATAQVAGRDPYRQAALPLIREHLSPIETVCGFELDDALASAAVELREQNLNNMPASGLKEAAAQLLPDRDRDRISSLLLEASNLSPNDFDIRCRLADVMYDGRRLDDAIGHYAHALNIRPNSAEVHVRLGLAQADRGRLEDAVTSFMQALQIDPEYAEAHTNLGNVLLALGAVDEAIVHYMESMRLLPDAVESHSNLGVALASQGRFEEACGHFRRALDIQPERYAVHENLAAALAELGRYDEAAEAIRSAVRTAAKRGEKSRLSRLEEQLRHYTGLQSGGADR